MAARAKAAGALLLCRPQGAGRDPAVPCTPPYCRRGNANGGKNKEGDGCTVALDRDP